MSATADHSPLEGGVTGRAPVWSAPLPEKWKGLAASLRGHDCGRPHCDNDACASTCCYEARLRAANALDKAAELAAAAEAVVQEWRERGDGGCNAEVRGHLFLVVQGLTTTTSTDAPDDFDLRSLNNKGVPSHG